MALIGIVFVAFRLHSYWLDLDLSRVKPSDWVVMAAIAFFYGVANSLLALAWWHLLNYLGASIVRLEAIRIYGISQLAKYVPGNIFHLAGRQALGMSAGMSAGALAKSAIWELGLIAVAGCLFGCLVLPLVLPDFPEATSIFLLLSFTVVLATLLRRFFGSQIVWSFFWQVLFLLASGVVFVIVLNLIADSEDLTFRYWQTVGGAYIVAWLIGLVTPGAPAGVGVRELILLFLLKSLVTESDLLVAILIARLVTVAGDLMFFFASLIIPIKLCAFEKKS